MVGVSVKLDHAKLIIIKKIKKIVPSVHHNKSMNLIQDDAITDPFLSIDIYSHCHCHCLDKRLV